MSFSCPYAVTLEDDENADAHSTQSDVLHEARKSCPAFANNCPFADAKSSSDIRQTLKDIPASHYEEKDYFVKALEHIHTIAPQHSENDTFVVPGGCPVSKELGTTTNFTDALEVFSLAAVMSKMAAGLEDISDSESEDEAPRATSKSLARGSAGSDTQLDTPSDSTREKRNSLAEAFKSGTAAAHQAAENVHFVKNFIQGEIPRGLYADLVGSLYHVYAALEEALDAHAPNHFGSCHFPQELNRREALEEDVDFWHGVEEPSTLGMTPATRDYVERIQHLASTNPLLLLAHAYTRYLGDLSGGKVLKRVARRAMNLDGDGLAFYDFEHVPSAKRFKDRYRQCLDNLSLTTLEIQGLVREANLAFLLNMRLFEELDVKANISGAKVRPLQECMEMAFQTRADPEDAASTECPFLVQKKQNAPEKASGRCPWPFVFAHDPKQGLQDYQTWISVGLLLCWIWSRFA
uniref:Uncharacterized protein n=1 Tax=Grammatophora oceanica TaxID=210454 RepID=A0A7S1Y544_9STRA|eukprot:CAMPEP_0194046446 /NCGR_PEP_ID=MMETSP0009_2-20130614/21112_1 /TAXON_ID=210454 /ORGANISM="Grammatophora oceanica, Strain CCMP 410" /LENGTH=463 /DNA_ID=CAMNT_0038691737 /DNA_START=62 /DNA_END=1453 /DNA_ORIENTATION=-